MELDKAIPQAPPDKTRQDSDRIPDQEREQNRIRDLIDRSLAMEQAGMSRDAVSLGEEAFNLAVATGLAERASRAAYRISISASNVGEFALARQYAAEALRHADGSGDAQRIIDAYQALAIVAARYNEHNNALRFAEEGLAVARKAAHAASINGLLNIVAGALVELGEFDAGIERYKESLEYARLTGDARREARVLVDIGNVYFQTADYAASIIFRRQAYDLIVRYGNPTTVAKYATHLAESYSRLNRMEEALELLLPAIECFRSTGSTAFLTMATRVSGRCYLLLRDIEKARAAYGEALEIATGVNDLEQIALTLSHLVELEQDVGNYSQGISLAIRALNVDEQLGARRRVRGMCWQLYCLHKSMGDFESALQWYERYNTSCEEIASEETRRKLEYTKLRLEIERQSHEADLQKTHAEQLQQQLDRQRAELTSTAMHLARQTELLGNFRNDLRAIVREADNAETAIKRIREKLKTLPCEAIDWTKFDAEFRNTYPDFRDKLLEKYPDLSKMELKVASLLKLKLTSLDISKLLCLSERSVETHRYNIRKKMGLSREQDIREVLSNV
jgi:tetratricopeptide (TPR) repeat protein